MLIKFKHSGQLIMGPTFSAGRVAEFVSSEGTSITTALTLYTAQKGQRVSRTNYVQKASSHYARVKPSSVNIHEEYCSARTVQVVPCSAAL